MFGWRMARLTKAGIAVTSAVSSMYIVECHRNNQPIWMDGNRQFQLFYNRILGQGAYGLVKLGRSVENGELVAVKIIPRRNSIDCQSEVRVMKIVEEHGGHANVLRLVDVVESQDQIQIVTEFISGGEVFDRLMSKGAFSESDVASMACALSDGVQFLHNTCKVVHGDLKPENILFSSQKSTGTPKIVDFGCAHTLESKVFNSPGTTVYWAPENFDNKNQSAFGTASDMFAIGIVLYICLYGCHPFDPDGDLEERDIASNIKNSRWSFDDRRAKISMEAKNVLQGLLDSDPNTRLSAENLLHNKWVKGATASDQLISGSDSRLESFQIAHKHLRQGLLSAMIQQCVKEHVTNKDQVLRTAFNYFDAEQKGFLNSSDVSKAMSTLGHHSFTMTDAGTAIEGIKGASSSNINFHDIATFLESVPRKKFKKGQFVFRQNDKPDHFYLILSGVVDVFIQDSSVSNHKALITSLGPGNFFGEQGLLTGLRRSASIQCATDLEVLVVDKQDFDSLEGDASFHSSRMQDIIIGRTIGQLETLIHAHPEARVEALNAGDVVFKARSRGESVYLLNNGAVELRDEANVSLLKLSPGEMFGETAVMTNKPRNASAVCVDGQCSCTRLPKKQFLNILAEIENSAGILRTRKRKSFQRSNSLYN